ncbi:MAG: metal ABC transporter permease [Pseudomonadota bacterium]
MSFILGASLLAVVTALACALPGVFVVLRRNSMLVEGVAHAVLPGIVLGYAITHDLDSPWLIFGAAASGLIVVLCNEWLIRTGLLMGDAPQALVFPALFAAGVILITLDFNHVHLHTQAVLVGDLNLAAFHQLRVGGASIGPRYLYVMLAVLIANAAFIAAFYPRLKLATFDEPFAAAIGVKTRPLYLAFMFMVSITLVTAFHAAGVILVVSLLVVPAATAHLVSQRLSAMFALKAVFAVVGAVAGFWLAYALNAATSAAMAVLYGVMFVLVALGDAAVARFRRSRRLGPAGEAEAEAEVRATASVEAPVEVQAVVRRAPEAEGDAVAVDVEGDAVAVDDRRRAEAP